MDSGVKPEQTDASESSGEGQTKRTRVSSTLKYALPSRLYDLERHFDILKAYVSKYSTNSQPVKTADLEAIPGIVTDIVARNNKFYVEAGLLLQVTGRSYSPAPGLPEFIKNKKFCQDAEAKHLLRNMIGDKWFVNSVKVVLDITNPSEKSALLRRLAYDADAEPGVNDDSLMVLIGLMEYADIIHLTPEGKYELSNGERCETEIQASQGARNGSDCEAVGEKVERSSISRNVPVANEGMMVESNVPKISIQLVFNIDKDVSPERIREITKAIIEASTDGHQ